MVATATGHIITAIHESSKVTASHCPTKSLWIIMNKVMDNLRESIPIICNATMSQLYFTLLFSHLADTFIQSDLQIRKHY